MSLRTIPEDTNEGGRFRATASGTLPNGDPVVVNSDGTVSAVGGGNLTTENFIGISTGGAVADTNNATVDIIGSVNEDQSGLTPGQAYYVQVDGSLSTTPDTPEVFAGTAVSATSLLVKL